MEGWKMINYYNGQLTDLLPHNITDDPGIQALSFALREGTRLLYNYKEICFVYCSIETMPDKILDVMAVELRTQYYKDTLPIETKRALVRNTLVWHMTAGTPAAVEELVAAVFGNGEVTEWFEFDGEPYWFRIKTDTIVTEEMTVFFSDMIRKVKNTRSHLDAVEIPREVSQTLFIFPGVYLVYEPQPIIDGYTVEREARQGLWIGGITGQNAEGPPIADGFGFSGEVSQKFSAGGAILNRYDGVLFDGYRFSAAVSNAEKVGVALQEEQEAVLIDGYEASEQVGETIYTDAVFNNSYDQTITTE
jgi:phage tail P2-like protein